MSSAAPPSRTAETYLAGFSASGGLLAGALVGFVLLVGIVVFDGWPGVLGLPGGGSGTVENATTESSAIPDTPGGPGGPGRAAALQRSSVGNAPAGGDRGGSGGGAGGFGDSSSGTAPTPSGTTDGGGTGTGTGGGGGGGTGQTVDQTIRDTVDDVGNVVDDTTGTGVGQTLSDTVGGVQNTVNNTLGGLGGN